MATMAAQPEAMQDEDSLSVPSFCHGTFAPNASRGPMRRGNGLVECGDRRRSPVANANQQSTALDCDQQQRFLTAQRQAIEHLDAWPRIRVPAAEGATQDLHPRSPRNSTVNADGSPRLAQPGLKR